MVGMEDLPRHTTTLLSSSSGHLNLETISLQQPQHLIQRRVFLVDQSSSLDSSVEGPSSSSGRVITDSELQLEIRNRGRFCPYQTSFPANLQRHMFSHMGEKPFACSFCLYQTTVAGNFKRHMLSHSDDKPFACSLCPYRTFLPINLKHHMFAHSGERPYSCPLCPFRYNQKPTLQAHLRVHSRKKFFACSYCDYRANYKSNIKSHEKRHTRPSASYGEEDLAQPTIPVICERLGQLQEPTHFSFSERLSQPTLPVICERLSQVQEPILPMFFERLDQAKNTALPMVCEQFGCEPPLLTNCDSVSIEDLLEQAIAEFGI